MGTGASTCHDASRALRCLPSFFINPSVSPAWVSLLQAPEGSPPDVWQQIPAVVLRAASDNYELFVDRPDSLNSLLRAAAYASSSAAQRLTEVEQDLHDMRQQMAQMQDSMAAVLAHLQLASDFRRQQP
jgi:hypothetical protein